MKKERQEALKELWETVVSSKGLRHSVNCQRIRGYDKVTLTFMAEGEHILKKRIVDGIITYDIFKPMSLRQTQIKSLTEKLKSVNLVDC